MKSCSSKEECKGSKTGNQMLEKVIRTSNSINLGTTGTQTANFNTFAVFNFVDDILENIACDINFRVSKEEISQNFNYRSNQ